MCSKAAEMDHNEAHINEMTLGTNIWLDHFLLLQDLSQLVNKSLS